MIWASLQKVANRTPQAVAIKLDDETLRYCDLVHRVQQTVPALAQLPQTVRGHVVLSETEPLDLVLQVLACWSLGRIPVIAREGRSTQGMHDLCQHMKARIISKGAPLPIIERDDEALVICTSGTTGIPKLVALPAKSVLVNMHSISTELGLRSDDLVAVTTPLTYMYGLVGGTLSALAVGAAVRLFASNTPPSVVQAAIRVEGITVVQGPPSWWRFFMAFGNGAPFNGVRLFTTGGESIDRSLGDKIKETFPKAKHCMLYGMTESGPRISHGPLDDVFGDISTVGVPFKHWDWYIEPLKDEDLPSGAGRLVLRGDGLFLGYLNDDGTYSGLDEDGYFHSNDIVRMTEDGALLLLDRYDRLFKSGGKLISPSEVETVLLKHPAVQQVRCFREPHTYLGYTLAAEFVLHKGASFTQDQMNTYCASKIQPHAIPKRIEIQESVELAPSGKRALRG